MVDSEKLSLCCSDVGRYLLLGEEGGETGGRWRRHQPRNLQEKREEEEEEKRGRKGGSQGGEEGVKEQRHGRTITGKSERWWERKG